MTVMGNAENVYASATQVFVATTAWSVPGGHRPLSRSGRSLPAREPPGVAWPAGDGQYRYLRVRHLQPGVSPVPGVGERAGDIDRPVLHVGVQRLPQGGDDGGRAHAGAGGRGSAPAQLSDNMVSVLQPESGALVTVGALHGLGEGEKIYSVRFVGDLGYVVTFNQTDPLYVLDLATPSNPSWPARSRCPGTRHCSSP